jgi:FkbM family methyltransferase
MTAIDDKNVIRCRVSLRNPFTVETLPLLSRLHRFAFRRRRRGLAKRAVGKPAKYMFEQLMKTGLSGTGRVRIAAPDGLRTVSFNARNLQFSALYFPDNLPVYETETSAILDRLVGDRDIFFDIGANWGWYSILIATRPSFAGSIHAFEPFPSSFTDLVAMIKDAGFEQRIHGHDIALAEKDGHATMALPDGLHSGLAQLGETEGIKVRIARLDSLGLPMPDVIKIDVEERELGVLQGASGIIEKKRPFIVFESGLRRDRPHPTFEPLMHMIEAGYTLFYPGWIVGDSDCIICEPGNFVPNASHVFALVPFLPPHRALLGPLINVVAVPNERMDEFHRRFSSIAPA